jgi:hypothetical protein
MGADAAAGLHQGEPDTGLLLPDDRRLFLKETIRPNGISTPAWLGIVHALEHIAADTTKAPGNAAVNRESRR